MNSFNTAYCPDTTTPQKELHDRIPYVTILRVAIVFMFLLGAAFLGGLMFQYYQDANQYLTDSVAELNGQYINSGTTDADGFVVIDENLSVMMEIRLAEETEWSSMATLAGWNDSIEVRTLSKMTLPLGSDYQRVVGVNKPTGVSALEVISNERIFESSDGDTRIILQETVYNGRVTMDAWWKGYAVSDIAYCLDGVTETTARVYLFFSYTAVPRFCVIGGGAYLLLFVVAMIAVEIFLRRVAKEKHDTDTSQ